MRQQPPVGLHRTKFRLLFGTAAFSMMLVACGADTASTTAPQATVTTGDSVVDTTAAAAEKGVFRIGFEDYPDTAVSNVLATEVLQDLGYEVEIVTLNDVALIYEALTRSDIDVYAAGWLPTGQADYWGEYGSELEQLGPLHMDASAGTCVPNYEEQVQSWEDLQDPANVEHLGGEIVGHFAGGSTMLSTEDAIAAYDVDIELIESSIAAETAAIESAIDAGEPIAFVCWNPMWWWARWDIRYIEDPLEVYFTDGVYSLVRQGFQDEPGMEDAYCFFDNFRLPVEEHGRLMLEMDAGRDGAEVAREYIDSHPDEVAAWTAGC